MCLSQQLTHPPHPLRRWASKSEHLTHCHLQEKCFVFAVAHFILIIQAGIRLVVCHRTTLNAPPRCHPVTLIHFLSYASVPQCQCDSAEIECVVLWYCGAVSMCQCVVQCQCVSVSACQCGRGCIV